LLEATPRRKGQTALPLNHPSYGGIECQPLPHSAQDRRRQATIPHSGCDRSPIRQLRPLLCHPGLCGSTVGLATRDEMRLALLPYYSAIYGRSDSTSSHEWTRTHLLVGKGSGDATCSSRRDAQHTQPEFRTYPLEGSGTSTRPSDLLSARTGTLSREVRDRRVPRHRWSTQDPDLQDPRNATPGGLSILQRRARRLLGLAGRRHDLRKTTDDIQDDCHARRHAPQCTFYSVRPLHPRDSGEDDDFHVPPLMYSAPP